MTPVLTTALPVMDRARRAIRMVRDTDFLAQADLVAALWRGGPTPPESRGFSALALAPCPASA